jgi:hypothetical protein
MEKILYPVQLIVHLYQMIAVMDTAILVKILHPVQLIAFQIVNALVIIFQMEMADVFLIVDIFLVHLGIIINNDAYAPHNTLTMDKANVYLFHKIVEHYLDQYGMGSNVSALKDNTIMLEYVVIIYVAMVIVQVMKIISIVLMIVIIAEMDIVIC